MVTGTPISQPTPPQSRELEALRVLDTVKDPEVPVLSVVELGVVRGVEVDGTKATVTITPTYSGCPAMKVIEDDITAALQAVGFETVVVNTVYSPAWTTDWIPQPAREKLRAYGIAPPGPADTLVTLGTTVRKVACPFCGSSTTVMHRLNLRRQFLNTGNDAVLFGDGREGN